MPSDRHFEQPVLVAVSVSRYRLVAFDEREFGLGHIARDELYALIAVLGLERDPFDIMVLFHRMLHAAHRDGNGIAVE